MSKIAEAYVEISAKLDRMEADLKAAKSSFGKAAGDMQKSADGLSNGMSPLLSKIKDMKALYVAASAVIAGGFVAAIGSAIKSTADHLDQLDEMSTKTGVSVEMLTSLELAAKQNGITMDTLATSIRNMYRSMNEASDGSKEAAEAYARLGIDVRDAGGNLKSGNDAFIEVAGALAKIENPAQRSAIAMKVFGRAGTEMLPMLEGGEKALRAYINEAQRLGLVFTDAEAKKAAAYNDVIDAFTAKLNALKMKLALEILPTLTEFFSYLTGTELPPVIEKGKLEKELDEVQKLLYKAKEGIQFDFGDLVKGYGEGGQKTIDALVRRMTEIGDRIVKLDAQLDVIKNKTGNVGGGGGGTQKKTELESMLPMPVKKYSKEEAETFMKMAERLNPDIGKLKKSTAELIGQWGYVTVEIENANGVLEKQTLLLNDVGEVISTIPEGVKVAGNSFADYLVAPFEEMCNDLEGLWGRTIEQWINGTRTFREVFEQMGNDMVSAFAGMVSRMAAQKLASSLFGNVTGGGGGWLSDIGSFIGIGGGGNITTGIDYTGGATGPLIGSRELRPGSGTTVININAIDTESFAAAVRKNPDAVISIVSEANLYGRRMGS